MRFLHNSAVMEAFPDNLTGIIGNVVVDSAEDIRSVTKSLFDRFEQKKPFVDNAILRWQDNFKKMGAKPKYKSSLEAVKSYYEANKKVYEISALVDFYNTYSLCNGVPMAAYDARFVSGDITLRLAKKDEPFTPLGNPKQTEKTKNGEIIYADDEKVMCRYWNLQDCHQTRITDETREVVFFFDLLNLVEKSALAQWEEIVQDFKMIFGPSVVAGITGQNVQEKFDW